MTQNFLANLTSLLYYRQRSNQLRNPDDFQVATGSTQVQNQTTINLITASVPIFNGNSSFNGNPVNIFQSNYANIINGLVTPSYVSNALGTQYASSWQSYQASNGNACELDFSTSEKLLALQQTPMRKWRVVNALMQKTDNPVSVATALWHANNGNPYDFNPPSTTITTQFNTVTSLIGEYIVLAEEIVSINELMVRGNNHALLC
ncbi:hypothetical protein [Azomonas macrocytogenes]|uniref:Uncharacterized protein n=1 Tax=Azomonas macrocytogenes TaxID=69962 RepID=A0A839T5K4_AZOMA|nr:hypothetical protein [Azomonas macrocytogenes]MBB3104368.1 hypothetical protein [Azomonas macrocytogenes]